MILYRQGAITQRAPGTNKPAPKPAKKFRVESGLRAYRPSKERQAAIDAKHAIVRQYWMTGMPVVEIARRAGYCSGTTVSHVASKLGLPPRPRFGRRG